MKRIILILLFISFFSAVLRPSGDSPLTCFRILQPFCLWIIYKVNRNYFAYLIKISLLFLVLGLVQNILTRYSFYPNIKTFSFTFFFLYYLNYFTIFVVATLVYSLWFLDKQLFFENIIQFASRTVKFCIFLFVFYVLLGGDNRNFLYIGGNINNFGCLLVAGLIAIIFDNSTKTIFKYIYIVLILIILLYNDSKLALIGAVLVVDLYTIAYISTEVSKNVRNILLIIMVIISLFGAYSYFTSSSDINGYEVQGLIVIPFEYIKNGEYFDESTSSIAFRTNSIVGIINILKTSYGIGVGPGNTSFILTTLMPDREGRFFELDYTSPHIWWLELICDLGWFIIIPTLKLFYKQIRDYCLLKSNNELLFSQIFFISFPLWCASASSLYTEYYCIMMITISFIIYKFKYVRS